MLIFLLGNVNGEIVLTEVMYSPTQASDTDLEWVEIYNNGNEIVNLSLWKIDNNNFDDFVILPKEFVVIARELIDGSDVDNDSFESTYGNNDGIWNNLDGSYRVFDGDFSLTDVDKINLSDNIYSEVLEYNTSFGGNSNGKSIEKNNVNLGNLFDNWKESKITGGTPGYGNALREGSNEVSVVVEVKSSLPLINLINITDDSNDNGIQIRPSINNKSVYIRILVNSSGEIKKVAAESNGNEFLLTKEFDVDNFSSIYIGYIIMNYFDSPGMYKINLSVSNIYNISNSLLLDFEYLTLLAISLDKNSVNFGLVEPGKETNSESVKVINYGNVNIDLEIYGTDLESGANNINVSSINFGFDNLWTKLFYRPYNFDFNLNNGFNMNKQLSLKLDLPTNVFPSVYSGNINIIGVQG